MTEQEPELIAAGKFALYKTPKGGMHLSMLVEGETEPRHMEIPAMMVKMMMRRAGNGLVPTEVFIPESTIDSLPDTRG